MTLKKNKAGQFVVPTLKPKSEKVWFTFQLPRQMRNELTKTAEKLGLNLSQYFRKKATDLLEAAKYGKIPSEAVAPVNIVCSKCKEKVSS